MAMLCNACRNVYDDYNSALCKKCTKAKHVFNYPFENANSMTQSEFQKKWWAVQKAENSIDRCFLISELGWFPFLGLARNRLLDTHVDSRSGKVHFLIRIEFANGPDLDVLVLRDFKLGRTFVWGIEIALVDGDNSPIKEAMMQMYDSGPDTGSKWSGADNATHVETMYQGDTPVLMIAG